MWNAIKKFFSMEKVNPEASPVHRASMPRSRVLAIFIPTRDFRGETKSGDLLGIYKQGSRYYIREGNNMLSELCAEWETNGLINIKRGN